MVAIKRVIDKSRGTYRDPEINLPHGCRLRIIANKVFPAKFVENGDLWDSVVSLSMRVEDDHTEEGQDDRKEFFDRFALKLHPDVLSEVGLDESTAKSANEIMFDEAQRSLILNEDSWIIREGSKLDNLCAAIYSKPWTEGKIDFDPEDVTGKEVIARVTPRSGKKPGSYTVWDSYVGVDRPKKKKRVKETPSKASESGAEATEIDESDFQEIPF
jgi:hypothetical protein